MIASTELINWYNMTSDEIDLWLGLLVEQKISIFIMRINSYSEAREGYNSDIAISRIITRWLPKTESLGIKVVVDFHTWNKSSNTSYMTWDTAFDEQVADHITMRQRFISYIVNAIVQLGNTSVYAFNIMNEPQFHYGSPSDNQFLIDLAVAAKQVTSKPIGMRFMGGASPWDNGSPSLSPHPYPYPHYDPAISEHIDLFCINSYIDCRNTPPTEKHNCSYEDVLFTVQAAHDSGKAVWITEFGLVKNNLESQREYVEAWVNWAKLNNIDAVYCWASQPDQVGEDFNIFDGYAPNPAFYELVNENGGEEMSFSYKNEGADDTTLYARKVVISEREIVIPAGETVEITLDADEVLVEKS